MLKWFSIYLRKVGACQLSYFLCAELCCLGRVSLYIYYALKKLGSGRAKTPLPLEGGRAVD